MNKWFCNTEIGFFGQRWPINENLSQQTISEELVLYLWGTIGITLLYAVIVKNLKICHNSQVTNGWENNPHNNYNFVNSQQKHLGAGAYDFSFVFRKKHLIFLTSFFYFFSFGGPRPRHPRLIKWLKNLATKFVVAVAGAALIINNIDKSSINYLWPQNKLFTSYYKQLSYINNSKSKSQIDIYNINSRKKNNKPCLIAAQPKFYSTINTSYKEWLGGLIDGNGNFYNTKKGVPSFQIVMKAENTQVLKEIQTKYGGSVKYIAGGYSSKYKLVKETDLIKFINDVNGLILNPLRLSQLKKLCLKYNIELKQAKPLISENGWFSGMMDSGGSIYIDDESRFLKISLTNKNKVLLEPLITLYGGKFSYTHYKQSYIYTIYKKNEVLNLIDNYFSKYPLKTFTLTEAKIKAIRYYYKSGFTSKFGDLWNTFDSEKKNKWEAFKKKWELVS